VAYRVLICEDEDAIREFVIINLKRSGYEVFGCESGEMALETFEKENKNFDIALLDVMLPGIDGFEVCKRLRAQSSSLGIIMLTAKTQETDKVGGLMIGADDYVTKPFSPSELLARIGALLRRMSLQSKTANSTVKKLVSEPFELDGQSRMLYKNGEIIELTQIEYQIMKFFLSSPNTAFKRSEILNGVWNEGHDGDEKIVDVNIRRLRMKIEEDPSEPKYIRTVWGYGYKWK